MFKNYDADTLVLCGDFNSRIGNDSDFIKEVDNIIPRIPIDRIKNNHGIVFLSFLKDTKMCTVNGRINHIDDNFTFIANRGRSVVDYMLIPHHYLCLVRSFKVYPMLELIDEMNMASTLNNVKDISDHSFLVMEITYKLKTPEIGSDYDSHPISTKRRYKFSNLPENFMNNDIWLKSINKIIDDLSYTALTKNDINVIYDDLVLVIKNEMNNHLEFTENCSVSSRKRLKYNKSYWNMDLHSKWKTMVDCEKRLFKCKGNKREVKRCKQMFLNARNEFDKSLRKAKWISKGQE
jgi:hypothetical protein